MIAIGVTDINWFKILREFKHDGEINFWTPTPWHFKALRPGDLFYFLVKAPIRKVGGYGEFVRYEEMKASQAWDRYGVGNGVTNLEELVQRVGKYADLRSDPEIGCIILDNPEFVNDAQLKSPEDLGAPVPGQVVKFKTFPQLKSLDLGLESSLSGQRQSR